MINTPCELCCSNGCDACKGYGHYNEFFPFSVSVEGKTFTSTLIDVDGTYRFRPERTGFSCDLIVEVVGECWRWALAPEFSSWTPMENGAEVENSRQEQEVTVLAYLPRAGESSAQAEDRLRRIFSL